MGDWYLYIIRCHDGTLYTGTTTDVERRLAEHSAGKGARYLKGRSPLTLVLQHRIGDKGLALRAEARVKRLSRQNKEKLVSDPSSFEAFLQA